VQRASDEPKMAGMWELPECAGEITDRRAEHGAEELCVVRHSITDTDYEVHVVRLRLKELKASDKKAGRWVERGRLLELPLTGLTRKILRKQGLR